MTDSAGRFTGLFVVLAIATFIAALWLPTMIAIVPEVLDTLANVPAIEPMR